MSKRSDKIRELVRLLKVFATWPIRFGLGGKTVAEKLPRRIWLAVFLALFVGVPVLWFALLIRFHFNKPADRFNWCSQRAVDPDATPEDQKAWSRYKQALKLLKLDVSASRQSTWGWYGRGIRFDPDMAMMHRDNILTSESLATFREYSEKNSKAIELIVLGTQCEQGGFRVSEATERWLDKYATTAVWPPPKCAFNVQILQQALRRAFFAAVALNDSDGVLRLLHARIRLARQFASAGPFRFVPILANHIVELAVEDMSFVLLRQPDLLSDAQLGRLQFDTGKITAFERNPKADKFFIENSLDRIYSESGVVTADGCSFVASMVFRSQLPPNPLRLKYAKWIQPKPDSVSEKLVSFVVLPVAVQFWPARDVLRDELTQAFSLENEPASLPGRDKQYRQRRNKRLTHAVDWSEVPKTMLTDGVAEFPRTQTTTVQIESLVLLIELEKHRRKTNAWPTSLDDINPSLVPNDPFAEGRKLRYQLRSNEPTVWSVGSDLTDNSGALSHAQNHGASQDWRLIPPENWQAMPILIGGPPNR